jgi:hypothetical protein
VKLKLAEGKCAQLRQERFFVRTIQKVPLVPKTLESRPYRFIACVFKKTPLHPELSTPLLEHPG